MNIKFIILFLFLFHLYSIILPQSAKLDIENYYRLGNQLYHKGNFKGAIPAFENVVKLLDNFPLTDSKFAEYGLAKLSLAECYEITENYQAALNLWKNFYYKNKNKFNNQGFSRCVLFFNNNKNGWKPLRYKSQVPITYQNTFYFYNPSKIQKVRDTTRVWIKIVHVDYNPLDYFDNPFQLLQEASDEELFDVENHNFIYTLALYEFICNSRKNRLLQYSAYENGKNIESDTYNGAKWADIPPETIDERILEIICSKGK